MRSKQIRREKEKNKTEVFKLPTYEGYTVVTRSVKPPKKIDKKLKAHLKRDGFIDFSKALGIEDKNKDET